MLEIPSSHTIGTGASLKPYLLSAIIAARGLTYSADIHGVEIFRELEFGNKVVLSVDLAEVVLRGGQDIKLRDGDIIWVPSKKGRFYEEHTINAINGIVGAARNIDEASNLPTN